MQFTVKKTTDLNSAEKLGILDLFNRVFETNRTIVEFDNQFLNNVSGYSYHSMMMDDEVIVGCNSYIPGDYQIEDRRYRFTNSVDTMVDKPYRDFVNLYDMIIAAYDCMRADGVAFVYGFPNDNSYPVLIKSKLMRDIGKMDTYCLPYRIGAIKPMWKWFNPISQLVCQSGVWISRFLSNPEIAVFPIQKDLTSYNLTRYKRMDGLYSIVETQLGGFVYKIMPHKGIRTAFLIDVYPKSTRHFSKAIRYILQHHHSDFDLMLYIGNLPFQCAGLIKLPRKFEPKNFHFTGIVLNKDILDSNFVTDIRNWDVNLSNYDLI